MVFRIQISDEPDNFKAICPKISRPRSRDSSKLGRPHKNGRAIEYDDDVVEAINEI